MSQLHYDSPYIFLSFIVAVLTAYVALDLTRVISRTDGLAKWGWILAASISLAVGIWSSHFIGMMPLEIRNEVLHYKVSTLIFSLIAPLLISAFTFYIVSFEKIGLRNLILGGLALGISTAGIHYLGIYSIQGPVQVHWDMTWLIPTLINSFIAAFATFWLAVKVKVTKTPIRFQILSSFGAGLLISITHFTGLDGAEFFSQGPTVVDDIMLAPSHSLAVFVCIAAFLILGLTLTAAIINRILTTQAISNQQLQIKSQESAQKIQDLREENEARFQLLVESVKDYAIFILGPTGIVETWNTGAERIKGYKALEIIGKHFSTFYTEEDIKSGKCDMELREAEKNGSYEDLGWRMRKDGTQFWANVIISAIKDKRGKLIGFSKVTRDLTERKKAEEALRKREVQLREAQSIAQVGSWEWDLMTNVVTWSDELFQIYDVDPKDFKNSYQDYMSRLDPAIQEFINNKVKLCIEIGAEYNFEHELIHRDGSVHVINSRGRAIRDDSGKITKLRGTSQDISERIQIEQQLLESQEELEERVEERTSQLNESLQREKQATEAKMQFLANMSHEIRTPMNAILGFSELLTDTNLTEDQSSFLSRIKTNSEQLLRLIDDILDLSKFEAGRIPLDRTRFSFVDLLEDTIQTLTIQAEKKGLVIRPYFRTGVPQFIISDSLRLRQILINLLGNAVKFSRFGEVQIHLTYLRNIPEKAPALIIDVEDRGIGISLEDQAKLFKPFSQADSSVVRKFGGTGLGLALSRKMAEALGGTLELKQSAPNVGSCFRLTLPIDEASYSPIVSSLKNHSTSPATEQATSALVTMEDARILLAEDSLDNEILIRSFLQSSNVKIDVANNGVEAVDMAMRGHYDCVLMDIQMPKMDGLEATKRLRSSGFEKPIIALTAHALLEEVDRSLEAGCNIHLTKPINRKLLIETINNQIQKPHMADL